MMQAEFSSTSEKQNSVYDLNENTKSAHTHFTLSEPSSVSSSRSSSPIPQVDNKAYVYHTESGAYLAPKVETKPPGRQSTDIYDLTLSSWRAAVRRVLVKRVRRETKIIARMQNVIRTPFLDAYFVYTSSLGTHTFFMTVLPALFFFGYEEMGRGLLMVLAMGVYVASVLKDLFCSPRPFAPPVTRLTIGTHHLEYGFPSTHSTNSVSIALFFFGHIHTFATEGLITWTTFNVLTVLLIWYTFSIVFGRLYTAMHSFTDCVMGFCLGAGIWWIFTEFPGIPVQVPAALSSLLSTWQSIIPYALIPLFSSDPSSSANPNTIYLLRGLNLNSHLQSWTRHGGWEVPLLLIPLSLLGVNQHPQPVDDCPCFEDAIAFGSVVIGALVARWAFVYFGLDNLVSPVVMPGSGWVYEHFRDVSVDGTTSITSSWVSIPRTAEDVFLWWFMAFIKMLVGIFIIFAWRIIAKSLLHVILPPVFRLVAKATELPTRRFYTPATDYKNVPSEFRFDEGSGSLSGLRPIPSVIDLPSSGGVGEETGEIGSGSGMYVGSTGGVGMGGGREIKLRVDRARGNGTAANGRGDIDEKKGKLRTEGPEVVKHYDADVLTKFFVYAGIAVLVTEVVPILFELLGWGVKSWPPES